MKKRKQAFSADETINNFLGAPTRYIMIVLLIVVVVFPLYWLATNSFKNEFEVLAWPPVFVPSQLTGMNYVDVFQNSNAGQALLNTVTVAVLTTVCCIFFGCLAGYAVAKGALGKKARSGFSFWFMVQKMYPAVCIAIPIYLVMRKIGLIDTVWGLIIVNTSFNLPMIIWLMIGFYQDVPNEMEEAGILDGCNMYQRFFLLVMPITKPGMIAAAILAFNAGWNEFLFSCILSINKAKTLSVVISGFITDKGLEWGPMAALGVMMVLPVVVIVWAFQKDFLSGMAMGSVKE